MAVKKFLDSAGTTKLWERIKEELAEKGQVDTIAAADNSVVIAGTAMDPTIAVKISNKLGNTLVLEAASGSEGLYVPTPPSAPVYTISKLVTPTSGYAATYQLAVNGVVGGTTIDIPKDMVVSAGEVKTVIQANTPYAGAAVGDKYIELTLANANNSKLYIPANSLVEYVTSGSQIGDMIVISIDASHQVTASITDGTVTKAKLSSAVQSSLNSADSAIQGVSASDNSMTINTSNHVTSVAAKLSTSNYNTLELDTTSGHEGLYVGITALTDAEVDAAIAAANTE